MENGLTGLFDGWEETMVWTCLQGHMGQVVAEGGPPPVSALCAVGDFCFLAGFPSRTLAAQADRPILVPRTMDWIPVIRSVWGTRAVPFLRYAIRKEPDVFDRSWLADCAATLPEGVILSPIRAAHIPLLMSQPWSRDLCGNFRDGADFVRRGLGVLALWDGVPVAGAASYTVYDGGIEIEIDTRPDLRRRGLALACGARLILTAWTGACIPAGTPMTCAPWPWRKSWAIIWTGPIRHSCWKGRLSLKTEQRLLGGRVGRSAGVLLSSEDVSPGVL